MYQLHNVEMQRGYYVPRKKGKVIIIDAVINEEEDEHDSTTAKLLFDILIMAHANGKIYSLRLALTTTKFYHHLVLSPLLRFILN